jgi:hypothetical protein
LLNVVRGQSIAGKRTSTKAADGSITLSTGGMMGWSATKGFSSGGAGATQFGGVSPHLSASVETLGEVEGTRSRSGGKTRTPAWLTQSGCLGDSVMGMVRRGHGAVTTPQSISGWRLQSTCHS